MNSLKHVTNNMLFGSYCFLIALLLAPMANAAGGSFGGGTGLPTDPFIIEDAEDFDAVRLDLGKHYKLGMDVDLSVYIASVASGYAIDGWMPIGDFTTPFMGSLDGAGFTVSGLRINRSMTYVGLFGCVKDATLENINVVIASAGIAGTANVGGLAGGLLTDPNNNSLMTNCHVFGNVTGANNYTGGLVGVVYANGVNSVCNVINCSATGIINSHEVVGGLVGIQMTETDGSSTIERCFASGQVTATLNTVGGLVGKQQTDDNSNCFITNCYTNCDVYGNSMVGGITGQQNAEISSNNYIAGCYSTGDITGAGNNIGGLVGQQAADNIGTNSIINSYSTSSVAGSDKVGGLTGHQKADHNSDNSITNCYATGYISSTVNNTGGLVGEQEGSNTSTNQVINCYATGDVDGIGQAGGLVGEQIGSVNSIANSFRYQFAKLNGADIPSGDLNNGPSGRNGDITTTADQFMTQATYTSNGWTFGASGPWYWDNSEKFPKLNLGAEVYPFPFYAITYNANGGILDPGAHYSYVPGETYTLPTNITRTQYLFDGWLDAGNTLVSGIMATDTGHKEFWAKWAKYIFDVTIAPYTNGSVTVDTTLAQAGELITLTIEPDAGYRLLSLTVYETGNNANVVTTTATPGGVYTFTMPAFDVTVEVVFQALQYAITVQVDGRGGRASADKTYASVGETVTVTGTPDAGYVINSIKAFYTTTLENIPVSGSGDIRVFTMPASAVTVIVTFHNPAYEAAWADALALIEKTVFNISQEDANTLDALRYRLAELINQLIAGTGIVISPYDIVIIDFNFRPAITGDINNRGGTNGYFEFRVTPPDAHTSAYSNGSITATPYATGNEPFAKISNLRSWTQNGILHINGLTEGDILRVYNILGKQIYSGAAVGNTMELPLPGRGIYVVTNGKETLKIID